MFHYVDDFVILGPPNSVKCGSDLGLLMQACTELGVLVADDKTKGPSTYLTILGIEVDSLAMELRLPQVKMSRLVHALAAYVAGQALGQAPGLGVSCGFAPTRLASRPPGQSFLRRLYNLLAQTGSFEPHFSVRLNGEAQADIEWWATFLTTWNGMSILRPL